MPNSWAVRDRDREDTQRRRELVEAARRVFERKGYGETSIADITTEAGVSRATFYVYFASKQDVFAVLADQMLEAFRQAQDISDFASRDVMAVVRHTVGQAFDVYMEHQSLISIVVHQALSDPAIRVVADGVRSRSGNRTARFLAEMQARGVVRLAASPQSIAVMGLGMIEAFADEIVAGHLDRDTALDEMMRIWRPVLGLPTT